MRKLLDDFEIEHLRKYVERTFPRREWRTVISNVKKYPYTRELVDSGYGWPEIIRKIEVKKNPPADEAAARELYLFISNDGDLYRQQGLPIIKNLVAKIDRGIYDRAKAVKLYMYYAESGAKKYAKEYSGTWNQMFSVPTRKLVAENFVKDFETEYKLGSFNEFHAKKYQKVKGMLSNPVSIPEPEFAYSQYKKGKVYQIVLPSGHGEPLYTASFDAAKNMAKEYGKGTKVNFLKDIFDKGMLKNPAITGGTYSFDVLLHGRKIDTVFWSGMRGTKSEMEEEVKRSLINHDGYDFSIKVRRRPKGK